jgi:transposase-like protein
MSKVNLSDPMFHDDDAAREYLETVLWPDGAVCPRCGVTGNRITKLQGKSTRPGVYKCKDCRKPFSVTVATIMERSHVPLHKWVLATQLMASSKKSMSAHQLHRMLGTNYETAWFLFHRLREAADDASGNGPLGGANKVVEADESYIGGKARNKAFGPPPKKMAIFTLVERGGRVRSRHVADVTSKSLRAAIVSPDDGRSSRVRQDRKGICRPQHRQSLKGRIRARRCHDQYCGIVLCAFQARDVRAIPPRVGRSFASISGRSRFQIQPPRQAWLQ